MKRRDFGLMAILGLGAGLTACVPGESLKQRKHKHKPGLIRPPRLKRGDTVGLIAPASPFSQDIYKKAVSNLEELGFRVAIGKNLHSRYGYLAGTDKERLEDLHSFYADSNIKAVWCLRGGYGTTRLLPYINYKLIADNPKVLIGYSDITALIHAINLRTGLIGLHGPVASSTMTDYTRDKLEQVLFNQSENLTIVPQHINDSDEFQPEVIQAGKCSGRLAGGNLSLLAAMAGTKYGLDMEKKLVFIEDIGEKPYRIDRMLTQLRQSANLVKASGILLGVFKGCKPGEGDYSLSLKETLRDRLGDLGIPVYYGFSFGHIDDMCTLPVGVMASFDTRVPELKILEDPFGLS